MNAPELKELITYIEEDYGGDYAAVGHDLGRAIYLLHYLERDMVDPREVQDISHALHHLRECFYRAHSEKRIRQTKGNAP